MTNAGPDVGGDQPLDYLVHTLPVEELARHPRLAVVYAAARMIVLASYNGRMTTPRVEGGFADEDEPLVRQLLNRYKDEAGFVSFPVVRETTTDELMVSGRGVAQYRPVHETGPASGQERVYFTSFPAS